MKNRLMFLTLSALTMGLQATTTSWDRVNTIFRVHEQDCIRYRNNGKRIKQKEAYKLIESGIPVVDKYPAPKQTASATPVTPLTSVSTPKKVFKVVRLHDQAQAVATNATRISGVEALQAASQLAEANKFDANIRKGAANFLAKQDRIASATLSSIPAINPQAQAVATNATRRISGIEVLQAASQLAEANKSDANIRKGAANFLAKQDRIASATLSSIPAINPQAQAVATNATKISGVEVLQAASQLAEANKSDANIRKGAAAFLAKQDRIASATLSSIPAINPNAVHNLIGVPNLAKESMPIADTFATASAAAQSACTLENAKSALTSPHAKLAGLSALFIGSGVAAYKYNQYLEAKAEEERLANRSYFEKASDSISNFAKTAKIHTWDSNYGFNHSGKVATVAGVAAVAGLSYLAYKKNPFGKAVVKTVEPKEADQTSATRKPSVI